MIHSSLFFFFLLQPLLFLFFQGRLVSLETNLMFLTEGSLEKRHDVLIKRKKKHSTDWLQSLNLSHNMPTEYNWLSKTPTHTPCWIMKNDAFRQDINFTAHWLVPDEWKSLMLVKLANWLKPLKFNRWTQTPKIASTWIKTEYLYTVFNTLTKGLL